jgi:hypothetical protein
MNEATVSLGKASANRGRPEALRSKSSGSPRVCPCLDILGLATNCCARPSEREDYEGKDFNRR